MWPAAAAVFGAAGALRGRREVHAKKTRLLRQYGHTMVGVPAQKSAAGVFQGGAMFSGLQHLCIDYRPEKRADLAGLRFSGLGGSYYSNAQSLAFTCHRLF